MLERIKLHLGYYISLIAILAFGFLFVALASPNRGLQITASIFTTLLYVFWGIIHHMLNHDLHAKIVVEYVLIGVLGVTMIIFIL
ncbi:MAG: hypothetical protein A3D74_02545 [Candidatus Levybacteria bacterium RIFCSPHIGHO2_02_FULL_37_13]|nr:MAG: hypothetical protein A3D74_02545 [Candidatus Levybacteria bacterium RIFCSPHIGHO2_02_FULL_37_13]OGH30505.1 MAG: hypothetical protein A3E40_02575 [Candidatus Levybacteria bacterium RIFCSPHIGHO2_12_FULL_37_9]OGH37333.1 MAG: hypothetical protein A3B41_01585 [Candidatus Levybacteria bacterium RIFCSPLOWO2_01_FULL_37_26]